MGLFSGIKNNWEKSKSAVVIQNLLEMKNGTLMEIDNPAERSNKLVADIWNEYPDVFNGKFGHRPHKIATAVYALVRGTEKCSDMNIKLHYLTCISQILAEVETNAVFYNFSQLDMEFINKSAEIHIRVSKPIMDKTGSTISKNDFEYYIDSDVDVKEDKKSDIIHCFTNILKIQLSLSNSKHIDMYKLGYMKGLIDNGIQIFCDMNVELKNNEADIETIAISAVVLMNVIGKKAGAEAMNTILIVDSNPSEIYTTGMYKGAEDIAKFLYSANKENVYSPMGLLDKEHGLVK